MKRILFNATHAEELRVAIVDGQKLLDLDLESAVRVQRKGNIYKAVVTRVEPSLEACFINYGSDRHGFLPFKEIYRGYFQNYSSKTPLSKVNIKDVIKKGQELIVQVEKDERGNKGAALTTFISLAGRFLVLMPNNPKGGGISRQVEGKERSDLKKALDSLHMPKQHAMIARTAALGRTEEELKWDYEFLIQLWTAIEDAAANSKAPTLIYQESNLLVRAIRDHLNDSVQELIVDDKEIFERASRFITQVMPRNLPKLKMHEEITPLFSRFQIENQIESAFSREVNLPSGGAIVIDHTEALISIDVNSARATKGSDIEETALNTNLEAVEEIARQLRIRDLGGLLVLDLIDMSSNQNQRKVESTLKRSLSADRARVQIGRISKFGLLEMSRQRIRASIGDSNYHTCPRCEGTGHIRSIVSGSLSLLRIIEEEALKENTESLQVFLPVNTAAYILNEKRHELAQLEARLATRIVVIPNSDMESPHYEIKRLRSNELDENPSKPSHELSLDIDRLDQFKDITGRKPRPEKPVIGFEQMTPATPPPPKRPANAGTVAPEVGTTPTTIEISPTDQGLIKRLWKTIKGEAVGATGSPGNQNTESEESKPADGNQAQQSPARQQNSKPRATNPQRKSNNANSRGRGRGRGPNRQRQNNSKSTSGNRSQANRSPQNKGQNTAQNKGQNTTQSTDQASASKQTANKQQNAAQSGNDKGTAAASGNAASGNATKAPQNRRAPRKKVASKKEPTQKQATTRKKASARKPAAKPTSKEADGNTTQATGNPQQKPQTVRKKRVSKKKTSTRKTTAGNAQRASKAESKEVDGNK